MWEKASHLDKTLIWNYVCVCFQEKDGTCSEKKHCIFQSAFEALTEPVKLSQSGFSMFLTFPI